MKYLLVVGFACDVYRQEPRARIFVDNKLIDEFNIQHHTDSFNSAIKNFYSNRHILQPFLMENLLIQSKNFPPLRFYEIEIDKQLKELELQINIDNDDSNHNNGFITKSTLLQLQFFYFFPLNKELLSILKKTLIKNKKNKNYAWTRCKKNNIFNLTENGGEWRSNNEQIFEHTNITKSLNWYNIGGSGYFHCKLIKKYGIFITQLIKSSRFNFILPVLNYLYDKYEQHANQ